MGEAAQCIRPGRCVKGEYNRPGRTRCKPSSVPPARRADA